MVRHRSEDHGERTAVPGRRRPRGGPGSSARPWGGRNGHRLPGPRGPRSTPRRRLAARPCSRWSRRSDFVVHLDAFPLEHQPCAAGAKAAALGGDLAHARAHLRAVGLALSPHGLRTCARPPGRPDAGRGRTSPSRPRRRPPLLGRRQFFPSRSFSTALSSIGSAGRRGPPRVLVLQASQPPRVARHRPRTDGGRWLALHPAVPGLPFGKSRVADAATPADLGHGPHPPPARPGSR